MSFVAMFLDAMLIRPAWLAAGAVGLTAVVLYWTIIGSAGAVRGERNVEGVRRFRGSSFRSFRVG